MRNMKAVLVLVVLVAGMVACSAAQQLTQMFANK